MPGINDHGETVSILEDFRHINKWIATDEHDFRNVTGTRVVNANSLDLAGIQGYIPDTYNDFEVKNVASERTKGGVCQSVKGPWEGTKLQTAMEQLNLTLNCEDEDNPHLEDENVRVISDDGVELVFSGKWLIRGWKIDLVVNKNKNGIREVEFFRDEIHWVKIPDDGIKLLAEGDGENTSAYTSTYWIPY